MVSFNRPGRLGWTVLSLVAIGFFGVFIVKKQSMSSSVSLLRTNQYDVDQHHRAMRRKFVKDPRTVLNKIPKVVHLTIADEPPAHQMSVIEYSIKLIEDQGYEIKLHRDSDVTELINSDYPTLVKPWETLIANEEPDRGARIGDFARMLLLHHYGGIYLDADMIPCYGLKELTKDPGVATFPIINPKAGQVLNSIMSGPAQHPVFWIALSRMRQDKELAGGSILGKTGPIMLAFAIDEYWDLSKTRPIVRVRDKGNLPEPEDGGIWLTSGLIKFGAAGRGEPHTRGMATLGHIGMIHLHWRTWVSKGNGLFFKNSECDKDQDLIKPFLDYSCVHVKERDNAKWSDCGDGKKHSGMPQDDK